MTTADSIPSIGLEIHVQLKTRTKIWCGCPNARESRPNRLVCPVCLGYPGVMPMLNKEAVRLICMTGLMLNGRVQAFSKFDRKNYFYPDQAKNYQVSQYDLPFVQGGHLDVEVNGEVKRFGLTRIHLEEDVAKSIHAGKNSLVDFNRAGTPLMEIVTEPDFHHPDEVVAFLQELRRILIYGDISDANLEEGNMRCDVNASVAPSGADTLGVKTELKNMNTFRGIHRALTYEIERQIDVVSDGGVIDQETRRWDDEAGITSGMRSKEYAHDYRYFPEPDLVPVRISQAQIDTWRDTVPELPEARRKRFVEVYDLPEYDAGILAEQREVADYFEQTAQGIRPAKTASNWVMTEVLRQASESSCRVDELRVTPDGLAELLRKVEGDEISASAAKEVFADMAETGRGADAVIEEKGLSQVSDDSALDTWIQQAIDENPKSVADYKAGKKAAAQFLMGQVMKMSRGKANPKKVMPALLAILDQ